jgi:hypothetical protein
MFAVPNCLSRNGSWFSAQKKRDSKGSKGIEAGWGACIDLPMHGCDDVRRCVNIPSFLHPHFAAIIACPDCMPRCIETDAAEEDLLSGVGFWMTATHFFGTERF